MFPVRYVHAADLHLDASFKGLRRQNTSLDSNIQTLLTSSTFTALERLVALCEREKPDFLVLAGDVYNEEDQSLKAQLALRDACARLAKSHIPVFIVHGNHDPISSRLHMIQWPQNTCIFHDEAESHVVYSTAELRKEPFLDASSLEESSVPSQAIAVIHGISHSNNKEARNLAKSFARRKGEHEKLFQLGVLHCAVQNLPEADRYAPCTLEDLYTTELDAWALGHVHERRVLNDSPFVAYSGNTQGLHINEQGERGCYLVTVTPTQKGTSAAFDVQADFHALSTVVWEKIDISLENVTQITEIEDRITELLEEIAMAAPVQSQVVIVRVCLQGHTALDGELRYKGVCQELLQRLQQQSFTSGQVFVWLKDIVTDTMPLLAVEELLKRDDLLGETLRLGKNLQEESHLGHEFVTKALTPLFKHTRAKAFLQQPSADEITKLLEDAARLCAESMENR